MHARFLPLAALATCLLIATAPSRAADRWNGQDKAEHVAVSAVIGTASGAYFEKRWTAFGVAMIPGLLKEVADSRAAHNHFSGKDIAADAVGAALGVQLGHWIVTSRGLAFQSTF